MMLFTVVRTFVVAVDDTMDLETWSDTLFVEREPGESLRSYHEVADNLVDVAYDQDHPFSENAQDCCKLLKSEVQRRKTD